MYIYYVWSHEEYKFKSTCGVYCLCLTLCADIFFESDNLPPPSSRPISIGLIAIRSEKGGHHVGQFEAAADVLVAESVFGGEAMEFDGTPGFAAHVQGAAVELFESKIKVYH